ncbi:MAG: hypothetical protein M3R26_04300 [Actinomycetota bacterium]|nr:hypothetical protein [Actinomycetota bacterium]
MRALPFLLAVAPLAIVAGGCGSNGQGLSKAEFVNRANAICAKYEKRVQRQMSGVPAGDEKQLASSIEKVLPVIREGNDELRSLRPPESLQRHFDRWMRIADAEVDAAQKLHDALRTSDQNAVQAAFRELQSKDADQDRLARRELGLTGCASGSTG